MLVCKSGCIGFLSLTFKNWPACAVDKESMTSLHVSQEALRKLQECVKNLLLILHSLGEGVAGSSLFSCVFPDTSVVVIFHGFLFLGFKKQLNKKHSTQICLFMKCLD